nr:MAG TPA: ribonucleoside-diphosphate reductase, adenosylcobalamin-dependent [Caudoviricetes sp.]
MFVNEVYVSIWKDRYQKNGESYDDQLWRVADFIAEAEETKAHKWSEKFFSIMKEGYFFPAGRTMSNAGIGEKLTLNNCFVAPIVGNSMEQIFDAVKLGAMTHKAGGGIGYAFSNLAPNGYKTRNDAIASGPVSFMDVFNAQTATVQQGSRRGANMGMLSVYHPDILEFIHAKSATEGRLNHFNLSVVVDDTFMRLVIEDGQVRLHWPIYDEKGNKLPPDKWDKQFTKLVPARDIWNEIIQMAYDNGEPGVFYEDNANNRNPAWYVERIVCSNPCAEYLAGTINATDPSQYGGACNLGSLFLHNFVKNPFTKQAHLDTEALRDTISVAVRMLDDIIDVNKFPDKIYENYQKGMRTIGIGITGLADMLAMLGMKYDSQEARDYVESLMHMITNAEYYASVQLAKEKGCFPLCEPDKHADGTYVKSVLEHDVIAEMSEYGIRNAKIQAVAPCGTISMVFGNNCSSGIEPIFSLSYDRKVKIGGQDDKDVKIVKMMDYAYYLYHKLKDEGKQLDFDEHDIFPTALNMSVDDHVAMLAIISKYTDMSVSKTINVPTEASFDEVKDIYIQCWKKGIKGCTIFRPNAIRQGILLTEDKKNAESKPESTFLTLPRGSIIEPSNDLIGKKRKIQTGCGSLHVLAFFDPIDGNLQEVYFNKGSTGGCANFMTGLSRMVSLLCRAGVDIMTIKDQLDSTGVCPSYATRRATHHDTSKGSCCPMAIGNALVEMYNEMQSELDDREDDIAITSRKLNKASKTIAENFDKATEAINQVANKIAQMAKDSGNVYNAPTDVCPECGEPLLHIGGCIQCSSCAWSKCEG